MKRALCIGINDYPGTGADLAGCVNDAHDWAEALHERGYDIELLLDAGATGDTIRQSIRATIERSRPGDVVTITYSGHGTWLPDTSGDEPDRRDEALCPYDYQSGVITDDDLAEMFTTARRTVRCVMVSDSCHSGTVSRLAAPLHTVYHDGVSGPGVQHTEQAQRVRKVRFLPPELVLPPEQVERARALPLMPSRRPRASALLLAGCADIEYSYDAWFGDRPNGAFTRVAVDALRALPSGSTYRQWHAAIRKALPSQDYPQTPSLTGGQHQKRWPVA